MQILLALVYGVAVGALAHYVMPGGDTRGVVPLPMAGAVAGGAVWAALTWAGLGLSSPWLWLAAAVVPAAVVIASAAALTGARRAHDRRERRRLGLV